MIIKNIKKKIKVKYANQSNERKIKYLEEPGSKIGKGTRLLCGVEAFGTEPYLIEVGRDCLFSGGIHLITHDGGIVVLNNLNYFDNKQMDKIAPIKIGDNVYIGSGAYVLPGITIGDNVIIGGCTVVTKNIPSNSVVAGIPGRIISTIDEYYQKALNNNVLYPTLGMSQEDKKAYFMNLKNKVAVK